MNVRLAVKSYSLFLCVLVAACSSPATETNPEESHKAEPVADSILGERAGQVRDDNGLKMKLVRCPPGKFTMGSPKSESGRLNDEDQVEVTLTKGFWVGNYEITQAEWKQVMATEPWKGNDFTKEGDDFPATFVNWEDAMEFCRKLTLQERKGGRLAADWEYTLPTEAQWEYACRAGTSTRFSFGDDESKLSEFGWWGGMVGEGSAKSEQYPHRVGQKKPNPWGLHDMHGNLSEWCRDYYAEKLPGGRDPVVTKSASDRGSRGGGWGSDASTCRSASRDGGLPGDRDENFGFRVALSSVQPAK